MEKTGINCLKPNLCNLAYRFCMFYTFREFSLILVYVLFVFQNLCSSLVLLFSLRIFLVLQKLINFVCQHLTPSSCCTKCFSKTTSSAKQTMLVLSRSQKPLLYVIRWKDFLMCLSIHLEGKNWVSGSRNHLSA